MSYTAFIISFHTSESTESGYVSHNIEKELGLSPDFLKTDEYLTCDNIEFKSDLSKKFYREYLIGNEKKGL